MRIGFIYFHHIHHALHSLPIAFELSSLGFNVDLLITSNSILKVINDIKHLYPNQKCNITFLKGSMFYRYANFRKKKYPRPRIMMEKYASDLNNYDILVGTSFETHRLLDNIKIKYPKYVLAFHGIGVRDYGFPSSLKKYDLLLLPGRSMVQHLRKAKLVKDGNWEVIGYPKFDFAIRIKEQINPLFTNQKPTVIYNPHWNRKVSSWYDWGKNILDYFSNSTKYNLIFAPHILIKEWKQRWLRLQKYKDCPNIHIDLSSQRLIDMTYTISANAYLGDVSSQVFEFLYKPRPCLFLNNKKLVKKKDRDFPQWSFGKTITDISEFSNSLEDMFLDHSKYVVSQEKFIQNNFDRIENPAGMRGAKAIINRFSL